MINADEYFWAQAKAEEAERRRNPNIDPDLLEPWGGHFKIKEQQCQHTQSQSQ